jgi:CBS domain containing-hemolysin-like protein
MRNIFEIILLVILLFFAALTAASETSIIAVSRLKLRRLAAGGSKTAKIILKILETPERFFGTILVANNIVDVLIASIVTAIMISIIGEEAKGVLFATIIVSFLIIVSEVAAKTLAARHSEKISMALAVPVQSFIFIFSPIVKVLAVITNAIVNLISGGAKGKPALVTEEEIRALIKIGEEEDALHKEKYKMLSKVFDFSEAVVKNVMTPKREMVSIDMDADFNDIVNKVLESGYSRLPVYKTDPDNIVGVINMKDLLNLAINKELVVLQDIVYPATFVPNNKKVTELLTEFQKGHTHLAIVADSQGKVEGLATLEDLLEEIVGEINDEYDIRAK